VSDTYPNPVPLAVGVADDVTIRRIGPDDPIPEITALLHRAYAGQVRMGLRPLAGRQDDQTTRRRCQSGECTIATLADPGSLRGERIVGVILFHEVEPDEGPPWFKNPRVDSFSQFAVDPDIQGRGVGIMLLDTVERRALACAAENSVLGTGPVTAELACSMAEPDEKLLNFYLRRGYRFIEHWQWPYTNYRSAILSKTLT